MRKITSVFPFATPIWFSGGVLACNSCYPNSPAVSRTYDERDFDTTMHNDNIKKFYQAMSYYDDYTVNLLMSMMSGNQMVRPVIGLLSGSMERPTTVPAMWM